MGWVLAKKERISSAVEYCPVFVFFGFSTNLSLSNKITPNCLGDARLKLSPASSKIFFSRILISEKRVLESSFKNCVSRLIPSDSIDARTLTKGSSTLLYSDMVFASDSSL